MIKLLKNLKPYTLSIVLITILTFGRAISELYLPTLMSNIVDIGIIKGDINYILKIGGIMILITIGGMLASILSSYFSAKTATAFSRDIRGRVFKRVENFSLHEFDEIGTSSIITRTTNDVTQVQTTLLMMLRMMIYAPMMGIGGIIMAIVQDPPLSIILVVVIPAIFIIVSVIASLGFPLFKKIQKKIDKLNMVLRESLIGVRVIRAFNKTESDKKRFENANKDLTDTAIKVNKLMAVMMPLIMLIFNFTIIAVIWFGGIRIDEGGMQIGSLMAFIQYISRVMFALVMLTMMFIMIPRASVSAMRINEILDREPDIKDPKNPEPFPSDISPALIEFKDVCFRYHKAEECAISHITFTAKPGTVTAIIGGTGSGKSTILNLIPRFYDVHDGSILIGGRDIRKIKQTTLRSHIGMVSQNSNLFSGSIKDNIRFGVPEASDEIVHKSAEVAQASDFIKSFDKGYDSEISQGGTNVSGGQKQRLAIARALAGNRDIYLFDDSFSALDFKTDMNLRKALKAETKSASVIMVSQRVSTVMQADNILVIENGKIEGQGTHKHLMSTCPIYQEIANSQLSGEERS